jgi:hypothetical protein
MTRFRLLIVGLAVALVLAGVLYYEWRPRSTARSAADGVELRSGTIDDWRALIHPHDGPIAFIEVGGKKYEHVRGASPYVLNVPNEKTIVFVTNDIRSHATAHVIDLVSGRHVAISGVHDSFGQTIGNGPLCEDSVTRQEKDVLFLVTKSSNHLLGTKVNTKDGHVIWQVESVFDDEGKETYHWEGESIK